MTEEQYKLVKKAFEHGFDAAWWNKSGLDQDEGVGSITHLRTRDCECEAFMRIRIGRTDDK